MPDPLMTLFNLTDAGSSKSLKTNHLSLLGKGEGFHAFRNLFEAHLGSDANNTITIKSHIMDKTKSIVPKINIVPNFQTDMFKSAKKGQRNGGLLQNVSSSCPSQKQLSGETTSADGGSDTLIIVKKPEFQSQGVPQENKKIAVNHQSPSSENSSEIEENLPVIKEKVNGAEITSIADNDNRIHTNGKEVLHNTQEKIPSEKQASEISNLVSVSLSIESGKISVITDENNTAKQSMRDEPNLAKNQTIVNNGGWKNNGISELTDETELPTVATKSVGKKQPQMVSMERNEDFLSGNKDGEMAPTLGKVLHSREARTQGFVEESVKNPETRVADERHILHTTKMGKQEIQPQMVSVQEKGSLLNEDGNEGIIPSAGGASHTQKTRTRLVEEEIGNKEKTLVENEERPHDAKIKNEMKKNEPKVVDRKTENRPNAVVEKEEVRSSGKSFNAQISQVHGIPRELGDGNKIQISSEDSRSRMTIRSAIKNKSSVVSDSSNTMISKENKESQTILPTEKASQSSRHDNPQIVNASLRNVMHLNESPRMKVANGTPSFESSYSPGIRETDASPVLTQHATRNIVSEKDQSARFVNMSGEPNRGQDYPQNDTVRNIETGSGGDMAFKDANISIAPEKASTVGSLDQQDIRPSLRYAENNSPIQNIKIESERSQPSGMQTDGNAIQEKGDNSPMRWEISDTPMRETVLQEKLPSASGMDRILKIESWGRPNVTPQRDIIFQQIMPSMVRMVKEGRSRVMMALRPKELGRLRMELTSEKGRMQAKFFVESGEVKETLERSLPELRTGLEKQGIEVHQFDVQVAREFSRSSEYGERMMKGNGEDLNAEEGSHEEVLDEDNGQESRKGPRYFGYNSMEIYA